MKHKMQIMQERSKYDKLLHMTSPLSEGKVVFVV